MTAYLILAFKNPMQVARLIARLHSKNSIIFLHVDARVNIAPFLTLCNQPHVRFVHQRHKVTWGGYSITAALISGMEEILKYPQVNHIALLSGQDYPLKNIREFESFLKANKEFSFLHIEEDTPASSWWQNARRRYQYYYVSDYSIRGKRFINRMLRRILPGRQFIYPSYRLYGGPGSTFGILTRGAAAYVVSFMENNPDALRFAKTTFASDEFWFQTLLMNSPLANKVKIHQTWYMKWNGTSKHPDVLTRADFASMLLSDHFFARKFDINVDRKILDLLDETSKYKSSRTLVY